MDKNAVSNELFWGQFLLGNGECHFADESLLSMTLCFLNIGGRFKAGQRLIRRVPSSVGGSGLQFLGLLQGERGLCHGNGSFCFVGGLACCLQSGFEALTDGVFFFLCQRCKGSSSGHSSVYAR